MHAECQITFLQKVKRNKQLSLFVIDLNDDELVGLFCFVINKPAKRE